MRGTAGAYLSANALKKAASGGLSRGEFPDALEWIGA
jgi:hypothetical protein